MKRINIKFYQDYKFNSVFIRTFLILILLTVISVSIFSLLTTRLASDNFREKTKATYHSLLMKTSDSQDLSFLYLSKMMTNLMRDKNITGIMIAPDIGDYKRNIEATRMISDVPDNNELVTRAFLYIPYNNSVVTSNRTIEDKGKFNDENLIDKYLMNFSKMGSITVDGFTTRIMVEGGRILLFQDYPASARLATLVFELNPVKLFEIIQGTGNFNKQSILVYDEDGYPIFPQLTVYPTEKELANSKSMIFSYQSEKSNWKFLLLADRSNLQLDSKAISALILPSILLLLIISLGLSAYIIYNIYVPINDLVNSINNPDGMRNSKDKNGSAKNEFDFFKLAYASAVDKSVQLTQLMESVSPAVLQKLFTTLLSGKNTDEKYIKSTLESIGNPLEISGHYMVLISRQVYHQGIIPNAMEIKLYNLSISKIIHSLLDDKCQCYSIETEDDSQVYILNFNHADSLMNIKGILFTFYEQLHGRTAHLPYKIIVGRGKVYDHISDIKHSFAEAQKDLSCRLYYGAKYPDKLTVTPLDESPELLDVLYYQESTNSILQSIIDGKSEASIQLFSFIKDISKMVTDVSNARQIYEAIIDTIIEKMVSIRMSEDDVLFFEKKHIDKDLNSFVSIHEMDQYTVIFAQKAVELVNNYIKKGWYKHIERAKEYIANNYSDAALSLNMVSDHIGLNVHYLSRLFSDNLNQRFVDYLNLFRVEKAKQLLDATNLSISDVGFKTGFNSPQNFIRVFKKYTGITPGQYKKKADELVTN